MEHFQLIEQYYALFVVAILFPSIRISGNIPDPRPEFIVVAITILFLVISHLISEKTVCMGGACLQTSGLSFLG